MEEATDIVERREEGELPKRTEITFYRFLLHGLISEATRRYGRWDELASEFEGRTAKAHLALTELVEEAAASDFASPFETTTTTTEEERDRMRTSFSKGGGKPLRIFFRLLESMMGKGGGGGAKAPSLTSGSREGEIETGYVFEFVAAPATFEVGPRLGEGDDEGGEGRPTKKRRVGERRIVTVERTLAEVIELVPRDVWEEIFSVVRDVSALFTGLAVSRSWQSAIAGLLQTKFPHLLEAYPPLAYTVARAVGLKTLVWTERFRAYERKAKFFGVFDFKRLTTLHLRLRSAGDLMVFAWDFGDPHDLPEHLGKWKSQLETEYLRTSEALLALSRTLTTLKMDDMQSMCYPKTFSLLTNLTHLSLRRIETIPIEGFYRLPSFVTRIVARYQRDYLNPDLPDYVSPSDAALMATWRTLKRLKLRGMLEFSLHALLSLTNLTSLRHSGSSAVYVPESRTVETEGFSLSKMESLRRLDLTGLYVAAFSGDKETAKETRSRFSRIHKGYHSPDLELPSLPAWDHYDPPTLARLGMRNSTSLAELRLSKGWIGGSNVLAGFPNLTDVDVGNCVGWLSSLSGDGRTGLPVLKTLRLAGFGYAEYGKHARGAGGVGGDLPMAKAMFDLRRMSYHKPHDEEATRSIATTLNAFSGLTHLEMDPWSLTDYASPSSLSELRTLTVRRIQFWFSMQLLTPSWGDEVGFEAKLSFATNLTHLTCSEWVPQTVVNGLAPSLVEFDHESGGKPSKDEMLEKYALDFSRCVDLRRLKIGDGLLVHSLRGLTDLTDLRYDGTHLKNEDVENLTALTRLDLPLTCPGLNHAGFAKLTNLKRLKVEKTSQIGAIYVDALPSLVSFKYSRWLSKGKGPWWDGRFTRPSEEEERKEGGEPETAK